MRRIYYAHCMAIYNTNQEARDLATLEMMGFEVINPNDPRIEQRCSRIRQLIAARKALTENVNALLDIGATLAEVEQIRNYTDASQAIMDLVFKPLVSARTSDAFAFRALPDGRIPAGVARELEWARECGQPIIELPSGIINRCMNVESTRAYLMEVGQR